MQLLHAYKIAELALLYRANKRKGLLEKERYVLNSFKENIFLQDYHFLLQQDPMLSYTYNMEVKAVYQ